MHPIVIIFVIFVALGAAYFLMTNFSDAQTAASGTANTLIGIYGTLFAKILIAIVLLYGLYYIVDVFRSAALQRKAKARLRHPKP